MSQVRDSMFQNVATFHPSATLMEALRRLIGGDSGFGVVLNDMQLTGLFTEFDLVKWMAKGKDLERTALGDIPLSRPHVVQEEMECQELLTLFNQRKLRRFPVMNAEEILSGGIMEKQIVASLPRSNLLAHYRVSDMVERDPPLVDPETPFLDVCKRMIKDHRGCLLLVDDDGKLTGLISEGDLLRARVLPGWTDTVPARAVATLDPMTISIDLDLGAALDKFLETGHRRFPVVMEGGRLMGLLTQTDLLRETTHSARSRNAVLNPEDIQEPALWLETGGAHQIIAMNDKGADALEIDAETWVGKSVGDLFPDPELMGAITVLLRNTGAIGPIDLPVKTGRGATLCAVSHFSLIPTPTGEKRIFWTISASDSEWRACHLP